MATTKKKTDKDGKNDKETTKLGNAYYVAPEMI